MMSSFPVRLLVQLGVIVPFLFAYTAPPWTNFWPLMAAWTCAALWLLVASAQLWVGRGAAGAQAPGVAPAPQPLWWAQQLACGLAVAAGLSAGVGLLQYFWGDVGLGPWLHPSVPGEAVGNVRQRNQQATLMALGLWAWLWTVLQLPQRGMQPEVPAGRALPWVGVVAAVAWLAVSAAATTSRTMLVQWVVLLLMVLLWRRSAAPGAGRLALRLAVGGGLVYVLAALVLPPLVQAVAGVEAENLWGRVAGDGESCIGRQVLWRNVLHLIALSPWEGWGWGDLDYAHYLHIFPGERFCALLDNAHNLPLHIAVELGVPVALALGLGLAWVIWRTRPWAETRSSRQLAWGVLALVGVHSLLEYPLWYGPFQIVTLLSVVLLLWPQPALGASGTGAGWTAAQRVQMVHAQAEQRRLRRWGAVALALLVLGMAALGAHVAQDFHRVSQLYRPEAQRDPAHRADPLSSIGSVIWFVEARDFAELSTRSLTLANAERMQLLAQSLLRYSPEPRVILMLLDSAELLGRENVLAYHLPLLREAYPEVWLQWLQTRPERLRWMPRRMQSAPLPAGGAAQENP